MTVSDLNMERPAEPRRDAAGRVIEWEVQMPRLREVRSPDVDLEPARRMAEKVLMVGIGATVLVARGVVAAVNSAARAGEQAAENPGPVLRTLLGLVRPKSVGAPAASARVKVPVVPIEGYDALTGEEAIRRLGTLSAEQLRTLREYEAGTRARAEVLEAIDRLLNA